MWALGWTQDTRLGSGQYLTFRLNPGHKTGGQDIQGPDTARTQPVVPLHGLGFQVCGELFVFVVKSAESHVQRLKKA